MKQGSNSRRSRGRGNGKRPQKNHNFDSAGPEGRVRGNAQQVYEKYIALARDAMASGDRIATENYFQHAEHYLRVLMASDNGDGRIEAFRQRQQRFFGPDEFDESGEDGYETGAGGGGGNEAQGENRPQENRSQESRQQENRQQDQRAQDGNRPRRDNRDHNDRRNNNNQQRPNDGGDNGNGRRVPIERSNEQAARTEQGEDADRDIADDDGLRRTLAI